MKYLSYVNFLKYNTIVRWALEVAPAIIRQNVSLIGNRGAPIGTAFPEKCVCEALSDEIYILFTPVRALLQRDVAATSLYTVIGQLH